MLLLWLIIPGLCFIFSTSWAQTYSGNITDAETGKPVSYVNIGIVKKNVGTVTNDSGKFHIELADTYDRDTLRISIIGYETKNYLVADIKQDFPGREMEIRLRQVATELTEVVVKPNKIKTARLGNNFHSKNVRGGFLSNNLGSEVGIIMRIKKAPTYIESVEFNIAENKYDSAIWRLNIYLLKDDLPGENILKQPIYLKSYKSRETLSVELTPYFLEVEDDFVVALELIQDLGERGLMFCAGFFGNSLFYRDASQGEWKKEPVGLGFTATVSYDY